VVGPDYRFGRGARGNVALLQDWAREKGIAIHIVPEDRVVRAKSVKHRYPEGRE
jgi:FAD synthase